MTKQIPTTPANKANIDKMMEALERLMMMLYARWAEESQYEDINDYKKRIVVEVGALKYENFVPTVTKMSKRPFGFSFTIGTEAEYMIYVTAKSYGWKRVK